MKQIIETATDLVDVAILYVDDQPKGLVTEKELMNYTGQAWWDFIELYTISKEDYDRRDVDAVIWKYLKK